MILLLGGDAFLNSASSNTTINYDNLKTASDLLYNILFVVGMAAAVIIASILGIKFMIGSIEEKAQVKESLIPFVIGCIVVFGAFGIWKIVVTIGSNFVK